jgi:uncharacterized C2H2 Zn-finger protein
MTKFECCGVRFKEGKELTNHVRSQHNLQNFAVELSCCGTSFSSAKDLSDHVKKAHHYVVKIST